MTEPAAGVGPADQASSSGCRRVALLALLLVVACPCLSLPLAYDPPPDDADLLAPAPELPAGDNAYAELMDLVRERFAASTWAETGAQEERMTRAEIRVAELLWERRLQLPLPTGEGNPLEPLNAIAGRLRYRAEVLTKGSRGPEALRCALTLLLLGLRLEKDPRGTWEWSQAIQIRDSGLRAFNAAFAISELDELGLARLDERLETLQEIDREDSLAEARRAEYRKHVIARGFPPNLAGLVRSLNVTAPVASALADTPLERFVYKPNRLRSAYAELTRRMMDGRETEDRKSVDRNQSGLEAFLSGEYASWEALRNAPTGLRMASDPPELERERAVQGLQRLRDRVARRR